MVQEFNRFGPIVRDEDLEVAALGGEDLPEYQQAETPVVDEEASDSEADEVNDADGDGHDDATGEFVPGNQEAAADTDTPDEEATPAE